MNSTSNGPIRRRSPSCTGTNSVRSMQARLFDAVPRQAERQRRAVDREAELSEQERQAADMVFVTVGRDAAVDALRRSHAGT